VPVLPGRTGDDERLTIQKEMLMPKLGTRRQAEMLPELRRRSVKFLLRIRIRG